MKHTAKYLDSGFYVISNRAAGDLCRLIGFKLPKHGYSRSVLLAANGQTLSAELQRTPTCLHPKRKWQWAIHAIRLPEERRPITLGKSFQFTANTSAALA